VPDVRVKADASSEHRLGGARIGDCSLDVIANPITGMFNFGDRPEAKPLFLEPWPFAR
jgi:hypothetical protein